jgi:hypothetical protein
MVQQQQQLISVHQILEQPLAEDASQLNDVERPHCAVPAHLLQPLLLTLLQLCTELMPTLTLMRICVHTMNEALRSCPWFCRHMETVAAYAQVTVVPSEDGTGALVLAPQPNTDQPPLPAAAAAATKAKMEAAYRKARRTIAQPLLHVLCPAVLKEVRRVEQGLNRGSVSSRISQYPGMTAEESAAEQADHLLGGFGRVALRVISCELSAPAAAAAAPHGR